MKDKIMYLIIGALVGAIITAGCFIIFKNTNNSKQIGPGQMQMDGNMTGGPGGNMTKPDGNPPTDMNSASNETVNETT